MREPAVPTLQAPNPTLRPGAQGLARVTATDSQLIVTFLAPVAGKQGTPGPGDASLLRPESYRLSGGQILSPRILKVESDTHPPDAGRDRRLRLTLDGPGDESPYTLHVSGPSIDPFFSSQSFRFHLKEEAGIDSRPTPPAARPEPDTVAIDYLAKDYAGFRQALLEFIPTRLPIWTERSEADIGIMLLELFAATADNLSYIQDRIANEAFLNSATQRRSVASHLALIGYTMDNGAAAHTWLQFQVRAGNGAVWIGAEPGLRITNDPREGNTAVADPSRFGAWTTGTVDTTSLTVFEPLVPAVLRPEHNRLCIYDWENGDSFLPSTALTVALEGHVKDLEDGQYLLFDDCQGNRDIVRLAGSPRIVPPDKIKASPHGPLTVVQWTASTPLHHDYPARTSVVGGNLVPAGHGETVTDVFVLSQDSPLLTGRYGSHLRLPLKGAPLAFLDSDALAMASPAGIGAAPSPQPRSRSTAMVAVDGERWQEVATLLDGGPNDPVFGVEVDDLGYATVVFGNGAFGRVPDVGTTVTVTYRVGGGTAGNLGIDTLILPQPRRGENVDWLVSVTNPLPAVGGRDLESRDHARRFAPQTAQQQHVAIAAGDYESTVLEYTDANGGHPVARARADFRWSGSWHTVTVRVEPADRGPLSPDLAGALKNLLQTRRLPGYTVQIVGPAYLPLDVWIEFTPAPGFLGRDVRRNLEQQLGLGELPGGAKGFFHPDNFGFGDDLSLSRLRAAIMSTTGIESATITRLARSTSPTWEAETRANLDRGAVLADVDQIIRLDNDPNHPQNGVLRVQMRGGNQ